MRHLYGKRARWGCEFFVTLHRLLLKTNKNRKTMKKLALIAFAVALMLTACAQKNNQNTPNQGKETPEMKKTLVVYFSATGNTKAAAQKLVKEFNADLYEITPEQPYTDADLDWRDKTSRSTIEMKDKSSRPAIKGKCENIADYDTVWIGFPIWWRWMPARKASSISPTSICFRL